MAAESVVKLKLESGEYEAKIKRATAGLMQMERECRNAGGILNKLEDENRAFVKSLGNMETVSKSAKGKIAELTGAFQDLRSMYNRLSDEEKKGEFGKELNKQLGIMKGRIQEAQAEMKSINSEMGNGGNALDSLTSKFGLNIKQLAGWGMAIGAAKGALDVAQQAFFASEANLDDWNRAVYASESAWDAFLTSINTGDISGFLSRINTIVAAASQAYNELDRLSTQKAINNPAIKKQEAENERFRAMLRTGRYIAPTDGRKASMQEGQVLTDAQKKSIADQLENGTKSLNTFVKKKISQTTKAIDALYKEQSAQLGMSLKEFQSGTANMDEFDKRMAGYKKYLQYEKEHTSTVNMTGSMAGATSQSRRDNTKNPYEQYKAWGVFKDDGDLFGKINNLIDQRTALQSQNYSQTANAYRAINRVEGSGSSGGGRSGKSGSSTIKPEEIIPEGSIAELENKIKDLGEQLRLATTQDARDTISAQIKEANGQLDIMRGKAKEVKITPVTTETISFIEQLNGELKLTEESMKNAANAGDFSTMAEHLKEVKAQLTDFTTLQNILQESVQQGLDTSTFNTDELWQKILNGDNIPDETWQELVDSINAKLKDLNIEPIKLDIKTGNVEKTTKQAMTLSDKWSTAANMIQTAGNALNNFESPAAKIGGIIAQTVATLAAAYAQNLASDQTTKGNIWAFIAAAAAATVSLGVTVAAVKKNAEYHAQGGIVGMSSTPFIPRGTDTVPAMLTPGEVVLSHAQTANLASNLQELSSVKGTSVAMGPTRVQGRDLLLVINNELRATGRRTL